MSEVSRKVFTSLWKHSPLQPFLDFSPIRKFVDSSQIRFPLGKKSTTAISVVIPCHSKDLALLPVVLEGLERNCLNPISEVIVISPEDFHVNQNTKLNLRFLTDRQVVDSQLTKVIRGNFPISQFGWVLQQVLKIQAAISFAENENILVIDSDTVITKPILFIDGNRQILSITREYHRQYIKQYQDFSKTNFDIGLSFVTHYQLWQREILEEMWGGNRLGAWLRCADTSSKSSMSEYHSYGSHLIQSRPKEFNFSEWGNAELSRSLMGGLSYKTLISAFPSARSVSVHSYS